MLQFVPLLGPVIERLASLIPDPGERARAIADAQRQLLEAAAAQDSAQSDTNKAEAQTGSLWIGGWRPAIGWACAVAFAWAYAVGPILKWALIAHGQPVDSLPPTTIDASMWELLFGMLGLSALRTFEKNRGIAAGTPAQAVRR